MDPHAVLGLAFDASDAEVVAAYRALAKDAHPDRAGEASAARMREINAAYERLRRRGAPHAATAPAPPAPRPGRRPPGAWLDPDTRRALAGELLGALEPDEPVLAMARATTWDSHDVQLALTDRRLLWLRDDAIVGRVRELRYASVARVETRLLRPLRRVGELRVQAHNGRRFAFADLRPRVLDALARTLGPRVGTA